MADKFDIGTGSLSLENRNYLKISGVNDVDSFDDYTVNVKSELGDLIVGGKNLHINKLDTSCGELIIEGEIDSLIYQEKQQQGGSFFSRVFK